MSSILNLDFGKLRGLKGQRINSVLGLALDTGRLEGQVVKRSNGSLQVLQSFGVSLSLDPLTNPPELVGREIRNCLDAAGIREKRCVVALPLKWAITCHATIPDIPEADIPEFLQLEAERGFPCDIAGLMWIVSRYKTPSGEQHATFIGVPRAQTLRLDDALRAAQLKPLGFSLGLPSMQQAAAKSSHGVLSLIIRETHVGLQVTAGGGIAALRALEGALESEGAQRKLRSDVVAREARITLAQLPAGVREAVRRVRIFGPPELARQLADEIELRLEAMDLEVELVTRYAQGELGAEVPSGTAVTPAISLAAFPLTSRVNPLDFLPPRVTAWQQFAAKYSAGKLQRIGVAAGAIAALVLLAFGVQQVELWHYQSQWSRIQKNVQDLEAIEGRIRQFRPWFDDSVRGLTIFRSLTQAFPDDGAVTAKTVEIRDLNTVVCTGTAKDYQSLLQTIAKLRAVPQIAETVNLGQTRGQAPNMQFSFTFVWNGGS